MYIHLPGIVQTALYRELVYQRRDLCIKSCFRLPFLYCLDHTPVYPKQHYCMAIAQDVIEYRFILFF